MDLVAMKDGLFKGVNDMRGEIVGFLNKGAEKKKTKMKLKELTEARLAKIPNYIAVEVAKKRIDLTKDAAIVGLLTLIVMLSILVTSLFSKLDQRVVALVPGRIEKVTEVKPGKIPPGALYREISSYISLLGNIDKANVDYNYSLLKDLMTEELKVMFWADSEGLRKVIGGGDMSQTISFNRKDINLVTRGKVISALVKVRVKPMYGDEPGDVREEYILLEGSVVVKKENNFWALELFNVEQGPVKDIARVKRKIGEGA